MTLAIVVSIDDNETRIGLFDLVIQTKINHILGREFFKRIKPKELIVLNSKDYNSLLPLITKTIIDIYNRCCNGIKVKITSISTFGAFIVDFGNRRADGQLGSRYGWRGVHKNINIRNYIIENCADVIEPDGVSVFSDVNCAALAEAMWGWDVAGSRLSYEDRVTGAYAYVLVGGGAGVGVVADGRFLVGRHHPRMGHIWVTRAASDARDSKCNFHGSCFEGRASMAALDGYNLREILQGPDLKIAEEEAYYLAQVCTTITRAFAPDEIIIGGQLYHAIGDSDLFDDFLELVRGWFSHFVGVDYETYAPLANLRKFIRPPSEWLTPTFDGALIYAMRALHSSRSVTDIKIRKQP